MIISRPALFDKLSTLPVAMSMAGWREILLRDIERLLNDATRSGTLSLEHYSFCAGSVINYGLPSLSKQIPISENVSALARHIHRILVTFEPRLDPVKITVKPVFETRQTLALAILFDISGVLAVPQDATVINLRIALDYSCGAIQVI